MSIALSVIIPCYNAGELLAEAVQSVRNYPDQSILEIIIINDGSTDQATLTLLDSLQNQSCHIIHQPNKGQAAARNAGLHAAKGRYILFLDADNKIAPAYISKGIAHMDANPETGVVYARPLFIGDTNKRYFKTEQFDFDKLLTGNYIDICALVRKQVCDQLSGFDKNRNVGHEDWEFWIRTAKAGWKFHYINEELFEYRILENSHSSQYQEQQKHAQMVGYIVSKHADLYFDRLKGLYYQNQYLQKQQQRPFSIFWQSFKNAYLRPSNKQR